MKRWTGLGKCLKGVTVLALLIAMSMVGGCRKEQQAELDYLRPLPPGALALRKITDPADLPIFTVACFDLSKLREAIGNSLSYLSKPSSQQFFPYGQISHGQIVASLEAFAEMIDSGMRGRELEAAIKERFDVYISVGCDDYGTVLYTGYYTPIFDGSLTQTATYRYPLYKQPADLVKTEGGEILGRRMPDGTYTPYPSRSQLEDSGELVGSELVWLGDPFEVYIAHVQGSAKVRLASGELITIGYAANNGHEYISVADKLISDGRIPKEKLSLSTMIDYFKMHPAEVSRYVNHNPRFVFFRMDSGNPKGSLNEPVIAYRSIATDKSIYPRGALAFLDTTLPVMTAGRPLTRRYTGFVLDQDTGGAIRAPGRCDVYMGVGDEAGALAGQVYQEGKLYYLFLKPGGESPGPLNDIGF